MKKIILASLLSCMVFVGCNKQNEKKESKPNIIVFNLADDNDKKEYGSLKLDDTHKNLLNRNISKESFEVIWQSWTDIHTELNKYLIKENFDWGTDEERIKLFNKIYFERNGKVKYYVYGVRSKVSEEKIEAFGRIAQEFFADHKISISKNEDFAQCGKASLINPKT